MVFNSTEFAAFFFVFFLLYWVVFKQNNRVQNILFLIANYIFYAWAGWQFLYLLIISSAASFLLGLLIGNTKSEKHRQLIVLFACSLLIASLFVFKYADFFTATINTFLARVKFTSEMGLLNLVLPIGISFYTFRIISYLVDIKKGKINACKNWVVYFSYVSFFPSLISGPIDKAKLLIPQLEKRRVFVYSDGIDGLRQIVWGLFKKVVVADNCATLVDKVFNDYSSLSAANLLLGSFLFTIQLYADFSGYSDMAIGFSKLLGFRITKNFDFPFYALNIAEFWRKWHISLTNWLTEYVFTPLSIAFRDLGKIGTILALLINFTLIGIWHGANWTYILFGFLNGLYFIPLILKGTINKKGKQVKNNAKEWLQRIGTFLLVMFTFIIFRSNDISSAGDYLWRILSLAKSNTPGIITDRMGVYTILFCVLLLLVEWFQKDNEHALEKMGTNWPALARWTFYYSILMCIYFFSTESQTFLYFRF
jgi:D-alanyl-lipoteichoic acid acyltransferase DltB (MBOAT superfamily)